MAGCAAGRSQTVWPIWPEILLVRLIVGARDECADHRIVAHQVPLASPLVGRGHRSAILRVGYDVAGALPGSGRRSSASA